MIECCREKLLINLWYGGCQLLCKPDKIKYKDLNDAI